MVFMSQRNCRTYDFEDEYLNSYWDDKFSEYVHNCFKRDISLTKNNKKKNYLQGVMYHIIMLGIGAMFLLFSMSMTQLLAILVTLLLGVFFMTTSLVSIFIEVKNKWKMNF